MPVRIPSAKFRRLILKGDWPQWFVSHPRQRYLLALYRATPDWMDRKELRQWVKKRNELTASTGIEHVIDHIIPLNHPMVCGLNVPWNWRIITRQQNAAKSNVFCPDQLELF